VQRVVLAGGKVGPEFRSFWPLARYPKENNEKLSAYRGLLLT